MRRYVVVLGLMVMSVTAPRPAVAGPADMVVSKVLARASSKFGREIASEGAEAVAKRLAKVAQVCGDDALRVFEHAGPKGLRTLEAAGPEAVKLARLLAKNGTETVWLVGHPDRTALILLHGEDAAIALVRHRHVAEALIRELGQPVAQALASLDTPSGRRLAMLFGPGEALAHAEAKPLLAVIAARGKPAMDFIWENKGALAVTACLVAFVNDPEPFLSGVVDLTQVVGQTVAEPVTESAREASRQVNWTVLLAVALVLLAALTALRLRSKDPEPENVEQIAD